MNCEEEERASDALPRSQLYTQNSSYLNMFSSKISVRKEAADRRRQATEAASNLKCIIVVFLAYSSGRNCPSSTSASPM